MRSMRRAGFGALYVFLATGRYRVRRAFSPHSDGALLTILRAVPSATTLRRGARSAVLP